MRKILITFLSLLTLISFGQKSPLNSDGLAVYPFDIDSMDPQNLSYLDSIVEPYNIFGLAEYHWNETTLKESKKFITYLALTKGLDKIVIERPYAYGYWINKYLANGDTVLLKTVTDKFWSFDYSRDKSVRYVNYYEYYKWLFHFKNKNQLTFDIIGIDLDQKLNGSLELWSIKQFIDKYNLSTSFPLSYPKMVQLCSEEQPKLSELKRWNKEFKEEFAVGKERINSLLAQEFVNFNKIAKGIDAIVKYNKNNSVFRENNLVENFITEIDSTDIVYGQFGHIHILRSSGDRHKPLKGFDGGFISKVESDPKFKSKVLSVYLLCKGCKGLGGRTTHPGFFGQSDYNKIYSQIGDKSVLIDFRGAKNEFSDIPKSFQLSIFLSGE